MMQDPMLIMLMIRRKGLDDLVMIQQPGRVTRILGQDHIDLLQHFQRPERNVLQIANGRRNKIEQRKKNLMYIKSVNQVHERGYAPFTMVSKYSITGLAKSLRLASSAIFRASSAEAAS